MGETLHIESSDAPLSALIELDYVGSNEGFLFSTRGTLDRVPAEAAEDAGTWRDGRVTFQGRHFYCGGGWVHSATSAQQYRAIGVKSKWLDTIKAGGFEPFEPPHAGDIRDLALALGIAQDACLELIQDASARANAHQSGSTTFSVPTKIARDVKAETDHG